MFANDEQCWKYSFVINELTEVLNRATNCFVGHCQYHVEGPEEFVDVFLNYGKGDFETLTVNVTADSNWAILKDVMKAVARRFE